jgi:protein-S-isoprenylcysteine O-methyltransferase Ste14
MSRLSIGKLALACASSWIALHPAGALACAACFGKSDSTLAQGMNMGILSLLVVVGCVLSTVAGFFIYLAWRSAKVAATASAAAAQTEVRETITHS